MTRLLLCSRSNACKFTPAGGKLTIRTTLVLPQPSQVAPAVRGDSETAVGVCTDSNVGKENRSRSATTTTAATPESSCRELSGDYDCESPLSVNYCRALTHMQLPAAAKGQVQLSRTHLARHDSLHGTVPNSAMECIVVRIEVSDTCKGIRPKDMVQCKLFCMCPTFVVKTV